MSTAIHNALTRPHLCMHGAGRHIQMRRRGRGGLPARRPDKLFFPLARTAGAPDEALKRRRDKVLPAPSGVHPPLPPFSSPSHYLHTHSSIPLPLSESACLGVPPPVSPTPIPRTAAPPPRPCGHLGEAAELAGAAAAAAPAGCDTSRHAAAKPASCRPPPDPFARPGHKLFLAFHKSLLPYVGRSGWPAGAGTALAIMPRQKRGGAVVRAGVTTEHSAPRSLR